MPRCGSTVLAEASAEVYPDYLLAAQQVRVQPRLLSPVRGGGLDPYDSLRREAVRCHASAWFPSPTQPTADLPEFFRRLTGVHGQLAASLAQIPPGHVAHSFSSSGKFAAVGVAFGVLSTAALFGALLVAHGTLTSTDLVVLVCWTTVSSALSVHNWRDVRRVEHFRARERFCANVGRQLEELATRPRVNRARCEQ